MSESQVASHPIRVKQSICRWCFKQWSVAELAQHAADIGYVALDLVEPADWPELKRRGLICATTPTHSNKIGLANPANHAECLPKIEAALRATAAEGWPNVSCYSGNRVPGITDAQGLDYAAEALARVVPLAEKLDVTLCLEFLNSKINHPGYMADSLDWCAQLIDRVNSPRFKLLFDIYHVVVQEGRVLEKICRYHPIIAHYHTAGVPGRHEIDESQILDYPAIIRQILATGYTGYIAQEFKPLGDPLAALQSAYQICNV